MNDKKQVKTRSGRVATRISLVNVPNGTTLPPKHKTAKKKNQIEANNAADNVTTRRTRSAQKENSNSVDDNSNAKRSTRCVENTSETQESKKAVNNVTTRRARLAQKQSSTNVDDISITRKSRRHLENVSEQQSEKEKAVSIVTTRRAKSAQKQNGTNADDNSNARKSRRHLENTSDQQSDGEKLVDTGRTKSAQKQNTNVDDNLIPVKSTKHSVNASEEQSEESNGTAQHKSKKVVTQVADKIVDLKQKTENKEKSQDLSKKVSSKTAKNNKVPINTVRSNRDVQTTRRRSNRFSIVSFREFNVGGSSTPLKESSIQVNKRTLESPESVGQRRKSTRSLQKTNELDETITTKVTKVQTNTRTFRQRVSVDSNMEESKANKNIDKPTTSTQKILKKNVALPIYKRPIKSPQKSVRIQVKNTLRPRRPNRKYGDFEDSEVIIKDDDDDDSGEDKVSSDNKNVPIYKQVLKETTKKTKDVYDFEGDSAENSSSDSDNEYDKEMIAEMKEIKKIERKQTTKVIKTLIAAKIKAKSKPKVLPVRRMIRGAEKTTKDNNLKKINVLENIEVIIAPKLGSKETIKKTNENQVNKAVSASAVEDSVIAHEVSADFNHVQEDASDVLPLPCYSKATVAKQCNPERNIASQIVESFFEPDHNSFNQSPLQTTFKKPALIQDKINIRRSGVNSPLVGQASPSRSNLVLRNGPYILQTKRDSLPSFNQDIVLNSTMVEPRAPVFSCRISAIVPRDEQNEKSTTVAQTSSVSTAIKRTKQTSILQFIPGKEVEEPDLHCTLFDANLLSPVKLSTPIGNNVSQDKRRVLRDLTNLHSSIANTPERGESDVEFFALSADIGAMPKGKPTRFVLKSPRNVEKPPAKDDGVVENVMHNSSVFNSPAPESWDGEPKNLVGIFQDFNELDCTRQEPPSFTYERKRKRYRRVSYASEHEDESLDDETKTKRRKKKGEMTKKEKQEFDAWATSFNELCDKIEEFPLEVE